MAGLGMFLAGLSAFLVAGKGFITASFALTGIGCSAFHTPQVRLFLLFGVGAIAVKPVSWIQGRTGSLDSVVWIISFFLGIIISVFLFLSRGRKIQHIQEGKDEPV